MNIPQESIHVDVSFYDEEQREKLLKYPSSSAIQTITNNGVDIPTSEFLTYYLFHRKKFGTSDYSDYTSINRKIDKSLSEIDDSIVFNGRSITTRPEISEQLDNVSEHIGESIGLAVTGRIHNLNEADWNYLKHQRGRKALPSFDFQTASDGNTIIQVENKGSSVKDNRNPCAAIKAHKYKIDDKKQKLTNLQDGQRDPYPAHLRYGTIVGIDKRRDGCAKCWLVDPEPEYFRVDPFSFQLLSRLEFIRNWVEFLSPRSQLTSALSTRLIDLYNIANPQVLDGIPLQRNQESIFEFGERPFWGNQSNFFMNKSHIVDGPAGGTVIQLSNEKLFLIGIREDLLNIAAKQSHKQINTFSYDTGSVFKEVECVFSQSKYRSLDLPKYIAERVRKSGNYYSFRLKGQIHYSKSGLVFGELPIHG